MNKFLWGNLVKFFKIFLILTTVFSISGIVTYLFSIDDIINVIVAGITLVLILCLGAFQSYILYNTSIILLDIFKQKNRKSQKNRDFLFFIAAFLIPAKDRDVEIGNMVERFNKDKKRFGQKRALKLLTVDVITSAYPLVRRAAGLIVRTILRTVGLYKIYKMFFG